MHQQLAGKSRLIVVLGMHRSGTSAITKALELLGVRLGDNLHPAGIDNPKGFWEDEECIQINEGLLSHLGSTYDRLDFSWDEIKLDLEVIKLKSKAIQLISNKLLESDGIWGFKDPRTCRLLAFWSDVFFEVSCEVSYILQVRNPASVVASLAARNNINEVKSYYLWLQHVLPSLLNTKNCLRIVVDYDEFMADPYSQLNRISSKLGLPLLAKESSLVADYENGFLDNALRHTNYTKEDLAHDNRASKMISETYKLLYSLAKDFESPENPIIQEKFNQLNQRLLELSPVFSYINTLEDLSLKRNSQIKMENMVIDGQTVLINQQIEVIDEKNKVIDGQTVLINQQIEVIDEKTKVIDEIYASTSWRLTRPFRLFRQLMHNVKSLLMR